MTPTTNTQAVAARREIGKWLNEGTNKPVDREALAQLCAGFDALTRPLEVAVGELEELRQKHLDLLDENLALLENVLDAKWIMRESGIAQGEFKTMFKQFAASRAPKVVRAEPVAYMCQAGCGCLWRDNKDGSMSLYNYRQKSCDVCEVTPLDKLTKLYTAPPSTAPAAEQGDKDAARYRWLVGGKNGVSDRILDSYNGWNGCDGAEGFSAHIDAAILASKPAVGEVGS